MRSAITGALVLLTLALAACTSIQINLKDGTARIQDCPDVTFRIIVIQGANQRNAKALPSGDVVKFKSDAFDDIDFSKEVKVIVFADTIPAGSDCPLKIGVKYVLELTVLTRVPGEAHMYEVDLEDFKEETPQPN